MDTDRKKRSRGNRSKIDARKKQKSQRGLFIYDIPVALLATEIKSMFEEFEVFIPIAKENHIRIAYIIFDSNLKIESFTDKLNSLGITSTYQFYPAKNWPVERAVTEIQSLFIKLIHLNENLQQSNLQVDTILKDIKQKVFALLAQNYNEIIESYHFLEKNQTSAGSHDNEINPYTWIVIFSFCYFIAYKISIDNLSKYEYFYEMFKHPHLSTLIEELKTCHHVQRYLAIDFLWQLTILNNQFKYEEEVIDCLAVFPNKRPLQLEVFSPDLSTLLSEILQTDLVNNLLILAIDYHTVIPEFVSNIYITILPDSIQGFTLFSRYIVIKKRFSDASHFNSEPALRGYTLMTVLHEYAHFTQRVTLASNLQWLNHESPEFEDPADQTTKREAGSEFMIKLFGYEPVAINIDASNFLFDINNWRLSLSDFQQEFQSINENIAIDLVVNGKTLRQRLKEFSGLPPLIGCVRRDRN